MKRTDGSWEPIDDYVLDFAIERMRSGERVAIVTLVGVEGSSPRPLGAQMAVAETGQWVGYLSGGCVESAVAVEAVAALAEGRNRRVRYGRGSPYLDIVLPCGSAIDLMFDVEVTPEALLSADTRLSERLPAMLAIPLLAGGDGDIASHRQGEATSLCRLYLPRRRLLVLGVGPVAIQLTRLGQAGGFEVVLQSPDDHTLAAARLSHVEAHALPSTAGLVGRAADSRTAIAFVFHDHDREAELLPAALQTKAFYIGALGSHETQRRRLEALRKQGFGSSQLARLHGPAGLLPHARSAFDIALSILAEIAQAEPRAELLGRPAVVSEPLAASAAAG